MATRTICIAPLAVTVTMPPPEEASTVFFAASACRSASSAANQGAEILRQIEVNGYDVLTRRARTSRLQKITALIRASVTLGSIQVFSGTIRSVR